MPGRQISGDFDGEPDYMDEYEVSTNGLVCKRCHSLVPRMGSHPRAHLEWHKALDER